MKIVLLKNEKTWGNMTMCLIVKYDLFICGQLSLFTGFPQFKKKSSARNAGDMRDSGLIPGLERIPGEGHGNPLQYSCLENSLDRGAWRATAHGVTKNQTRLK